MTGKTTRPPTKYRRTHHNHHHDTVERNQTEICHSQTRFRHAGRESNHDRHEKDIEVNLSPRPNTWPRPDDSEKVGKRKRETRLRRPYCVQNEAIAANTDYDLLWVSDSVLIIIRFSSWELFANFLISCTYFSDDSTGGLMPDVMNLLHISSILICQFIGI